MNTPVVYYEQRQRLDMAQKQDSLKHKMMKRPEREELVNKHILEGNFSNKSYFIFICINIAFVLI